MLAVLLVNEIETPLGVCEDCLFDKEWRKVLEIPERAQKLCYGVVV